MLDIGWSEMAVIALVLLLVVGPKDLPGVLRTVGKWVRRAQGMARDFQSSVEDMAREAEFDEARKQVETIQNFDLDGAAEAAVDGDRSIRNGLNPKEFEADENDSGYDDSPDWDENDSSETAENQDILADTADDNADDDIVDPDRAPARARDT